MLRLWLTLVEGPKDLVTVAVPPATSWMVGRDEAMNDLVIHDESVSRLHARLAFQNDRYILTDIDSKSGTFRNGARITSQVALEDGDTIRVGNLTMRCRLGRWVRSEEDDESETLFR